MVSGAILPESTLYSTWFAVFSAFVAINTLIYVTLAALKTLPVIRPREWVPRRYTRAETRSIYPDAREGVPDVHALGSEPLANGSRPRHRKG